jgi:hypothetical protein
MEINPEIQSIGNNWFRTGDSSFEYNIGSNPQAKLHDDRRPLASVFRHIDGNKVVAKIWGQPEKSFFYKDSDYKKALDLAKNFINDYFTELDIQLDIFSAA